MGSIITLSIATDYLGDLEKNPEKLFSAIRGGLVSSSDCAGVTVHRLHHYSEPGLYLVAEAQSLEFEAHSLERLMEEKPDYWGSEAGLAVLLQRARYAQATVAHVESLVKIRQALLAQETRDNLQP